MPIFHCVDIFLHSIKWMLWLNQICNFVEDSWRRRVMGDDLPREPVDGRLFILSFTKVENDHCARQFSQLRWKFVIKATMSTRNDSKMFRLPSLPVSPGLSRACAKLALASRHRRQIWPQSAGVDRTWATESRRLLQHLPMPRAARVPRCFPNCWRRHSTDSAPFSSSSSTKAS